jgi:hypothetical protein
MYLGKRCKYAGECPVYQDNIKNLGKPVFLVRNVFCNRGIKGWSNCKRYVALESGKSVNENTTPYKL